MKLVVRRRLLGRLALKTPAAADSIPVRPPDPASVGTASKETLQQITDGEGLKLGMGVAAS